ncbi:nucleolar complex protein 4 [Spatholobus suberectus]|nr:nucleolar complex protein 4 [Spatholobus suberectus]
MACVDPPRKKRKGRYGVAELKTLGNQLLSSASHINNLPLLLSFVSPSSPPHHVLESLLSLHSFFLPLLPKLPSSSSAAAASLRRRPIRVHLPRLAPFQVRRVPQVPRRRSRLAAVR